MNGWWIQISFFQNSVEKGGNVTIFRKSVKSKFLFENIIIKTGLEERDTFGGKQIKKGDWKQELKVDVNILKCIYFCTAYLSSLMVSPWVSRFFAWNDTLTLSL